MRNTIPISRCCCDVELPTYPPTYTYSGWTLYRDYLTPGFRYISDFKTPFEEYITFTDRDRTNTPGFPIRLDLWYGTISYEIELPNLITSARLFNLAGLIPDDDGTGFFDGVTNRTATFEIQIQKSNDSAIHTETPEIFEPAWENTGSILSFDVTRPFQDGVGEASDFDVTTIVNEWITLYGGLGVGAMRFVINQLAPEQIPGPSERLRCQFIHNWQNVGPAPLAGLGGFEITE